MSAIDEGLAKARSAGYRAVGLTGYEAACTRYANVIDPTRYVPRLRRRRLEYAAPQM